MKGYPIQLGNHGSNIYQTWSLYLLSANMVVPVVCGPAGEQEGADPLP